MQDVSCKVLHGHTVMIRGERGVVPVYSHAMVNAENLDGRLLSSLDITAELGGFSPASSSFLQIVTDFSSCVATGTPFLIRKLLPKILFRFFTWIFIQRMAGPIKPLADIASSRYHFNLLPTNSQTEKTTNDRYTLASEKTHQMTYDVPLVNLETAKSNVLEGETSKRREKSSLREQESNPNLQNDLISEAEVYEDQARTSTLKKPTGYLTNNSVEDNSLITEPNTQGRGPSILNSSARSFISDEFLSSDVDKQDPRSKPQEKDERIPSLLQTASVVMSRLHSANTNEHTRKLTQAEPMHLIIQPPGPSYISLEPSNFIKDKFIRKGQSISEADVQLLNPNAPDTDSASLRVLIAAPLEPLAEKTPLQEETDVQTHDGCTDQVPPPKDSSHMKIRKISHENNMKIIPSDHECLSTHLDDSPVILTGQYPDTIPPSHSEDVDQIVHSGNEKLSKARQIELARELAGCQELLRMQCNLNAVYKKELVSLGQQLSQRESNEAKMISNMKKIIQSQIDHINKLHKDTLASSERFIHR
ncbi:unnamed protein product [Timema podura]|uniref:Uncharacterized protein n=1 Tax=Timema podura TaxID=61482 RepID=A0ABN7NT85_TIMPD|nr:unnamed protein product [Timema podura]